MKRALFQVALAVLSGCLWFLACADFDIWPLAWFAFVPTLLVVRHEQPRRAFLLGWLTGLVANAGGFYWITTLLMRFGQMSLLPALLLFLLLVAYQGLHFGVLTYLVRHIGRKAPRLPMTLLAPLLMTALELVMPFVFPWYVAITQAWVIPVIQVADLAGPLGVTFLLMLVNGMIYDAIVARRDGRPLPLRPLAVGVGVLVLALIYGGVRLQQIDAEWQAGPKTTIGLVQGNIGITQKGRPGLAEKHLAIYQQQSRELMQQGAELLVWPESAYPYAFRRAMERDWPAGHRRQVMEGIEVPLLFGTLTYHPADPYPYNSAYMMEPDGRITGRFDKNFLLIFGEYIPFYEHVPSFKRWFPAASHFAHGTEVTTFPFKDYKLGPMICYEDIIPAFGRRLAKLEPNLLVNITNDAWFGATSEPYEHLALAVYRSVEHRLGMARAVNTGVSAFIDASGRVYAKTKSYDPVVTPGVPPSTLLEQVTMMPPRRTVYAVVGDLFGYLNLVGLLLLTFLPGRLLRRGQRGGELPGDGSEQQPPPGDKPRRRKGRRKK